MPSRPVLGAIHNVPLVKRALEACPEETHEVPTREEVCTVVCLRTAATAVLLDYADVERDTRALHLDDWSKVEEYEKEVLKAATPPAPLNQIPGDALAVLTQQIAQQHQELVQLMQQTQQQMQQMQQQMQQRMGNAEAQMTELNTNMTALLNWRRNQAAYNYNSRSFGDVTSTVPLEIVPNSAGMAWEQYKDVGNEFSPEIFASPLALQHANNHKIDTALAFYQQNVQGALPQGVVSLGTKRDLVRRVLVGLL